jgi:hypothetical protein
MRIPLTGGAYAAKSIIANAQRCVNLYGEQNPQDAAAPFTYYPTPGLTLVSTPPVSGECRAIYTATNGNRYDVVGPFVYFVDASQTYKQIGVLTSESGPVSMVDNGTQAFIVDGTTSGFVVDISANTMTATTDPAFYGADKVDYVDGYFIFNQPRTQHFYISKFNDITFDPLDIASKSTYADNLVIHAVMHREIWLFGELTTEVWYNTGAADFTFGRMPGVFIEHGCAAKHSVAKIDLSLFWLSKDLQGRGIVFAGKNYTAERISTHAIEQEISTYSRIDDAIGFSYMQGGHAFYVLTFPTANATWCFDVATGQWHQRAYLEADGSLSRHRMNCHSSNGGQNLVGDWETGNVYALDPNAFTDNGAPILCVRGFPHISGADGNRVLFRQFIADMEVGNIYSPAPLTQYAQDTLTTADSASTVTTSDQVSAFMTEQASSVPDTRPPMVNLRWSDDRGRSWGNPVQASMGATGESLTSIQFQRLGYARDRVFELSWSAPVKTALNGAYVDVSRART